MRKSQILLPTVKTRVAALKGKKIRFAVHSGRNRYTKYIGCIESLYPCLFTVRIDSPTTLALLSFSYNDILCKNFVFLRADDKASNASQ